MVKTREKLFGSRLSHLKKDILTLPNLLTVIRIASVPFILFLIYIDTPGTRIVSFVLYVLATITDYLDGYFARKYGEVSVTGKLLDPLADKFIVILTFILLVSMNEVTVLPVILLLAREFYIFGVRNIAMEHGIVIPAGISGKIKTFLQMLSLSMFIMNPDVLTSFDLTFNSTLGGHIILWTSLLFSYYSAFCYSNKLRKRIFDEQT